MSARAQCTPWGDCVRNSVRWCQNTCVTYTPAHALVLKAPVLMHAALTAKNAHAPVHACLCNGARCRNLFNMKTIAIYLDGAETSLLWKLLRTILSLLQPLCRLLFAVRPPAVSTKEVARHCLLKKTFPIHASSWRDCRCIVAQASSDHPHWCGPHPDGLCFALALGSEAHP